MFSFDESKSGRTNKIIIPKCNEIHKIYNEYFIINKNR